MRVVVAGIAIAALSAPVQAQSSADDLRGFLYEGRIAEGIEAFLERQDDAEAAFGLGFLTFAAGVEDLAAAFYRHGFDPRRGIATSPIFGMPAAPERIGSPRALVYEDFRTYL